jgi:hypothetical protein
VTHLFAHVLRSCTHRGAKHAANSNNTHATDHTWLCTAGRHAAHVAQPSQAWPLCLPAPHVRSQHPPAAVLPATGGERQARGAALLWHGLLPWQLWQGGWVGWEPTHCRWHWIGMPLHSQHMVGHNTRCVLSPQPMCGTQVVHSTSAWGSLLSRHRSACFFAPSPGSLHHSPHSPMPLATPTGTRLLHWVPRKPWPHKRPGLSHTVARHRKEVRLLGRRGT